MIEMMKWPVQVLHAASFAYGWQQVFCTAASFAWGIFFVGLLLATLLWHSKHEKYFPIYHGVVVGTLVWLFAKKQSINLCNAIEAQFIPR
jgi:hypothetical protein